MTERRGSESLSDQISENLQISQDSRHTLYDRVIEACDLHQDKIVQYYCKFHDQVICDICWSEDHMSCTDVTDIDDQCSGGPWNQQVGFHLAKTQALLSDFKRIGSDTDKGNSDLMRQEKKCFDDMKELRKKINTTFDVLESDIYEQVIKTKSTFVKSLSGPKETTENSVKFLEKTISNLQSARSSGQDRQKFIAMKKARLNKMEEVFNEIEQDVYQVEISLEFDVALIETIENAKKLGRMVVNKASSQPFPGTRVRAGESVRYHPMKDRHVVKIGEFDVKESTDEHACIVGGSQFFEDGQMILIDCGNKKVKLLDDQLKLTMSIQLPCEPHDVTLISQQEAVITLPGIQKLQFVKVAPQLMLTRQVAMDRRCWGITCHNKKLYTAGLDGEYLAVLVLDLKGRRKNIIRTDEGSRCGEYVYIAVDNSGRLYISNNNKQFILCITPEGQHVYRYIDVELKCPVSLLVDADSNVYVSGNKSNNVQVISSDGKKYRTLIQPTEGGVVGPLALAYRCTDRTLVVGMIEKNIIIAFRLQ